MKLAPSDGALYSSGKNLLAHLEAWRVDDPEGCSHRRGAVASWPAWRGVLEGRTRSELERRN